MAKGGQRPATGTRDARPLSIEALGYGWLLFDADGTLFDYERAERRALRSALGSAGHDFSDESRDIYREVNAALWRALESGEVDAETLRYRRFELLFGRLGLPLEAARSAAEDYLVELGRCSDLLPGAADLIGALVGRATLALVTNGLAEVQRSRLARSPITRHFEAITISDELGVAKPDPRIIDHTLEALGGPPRGEVLIIGDSLASDIQAGLNAGIATCWFAPHGGEPPDATRPDHVVRDLDEIRALAPSVDFRQ